MGKVHGSCSSKVIVWVKELAPFWFEGSFFFFGLIKF